MKIMRRIIAVLLAGTAATVHADSSVMQLAEVTGNNIALVSAMLSEHQKGINAISAKRIELIVSVESMATEAQFRVAREVALLKQTGGEDLVKTLQWLRDRADQAANAPSQIDMLQIQTKQDIFSIYKPLAISVDKLDEAAKALASVAKPMPRNQRAGFVLAYVRAAREEVNKLKSESEAKKNSGDSAIDSKMVRLETPNGGAKTNPKP